MDSVLILADSFVAEVFLQRISRKDAAGNSYTVVTPMDIEEYVPKSSNISIEHFDPTSSVKLNKILYAQSFKTVFVLMSSPEEAQACMDNIRSVDDKVEIVLLDEWGSFSVLEDSATHVINGPELIANRLYDNLPNVPVVAQNVGLTQGEIMEVLVPYGSSFAYRHVGSIAQVKWKIAAIYRDGKQILPTNATMIYPQDTLLILGKPQVLSSVYRRISKNKEKFPEPFGRYLYLVLDMEKDSSRALSHLKESIHLLERLEDGKLYVRIVNPGDLGEIEEIKKLETEEVNIHIKYGENNLTEIIIDDVTEFDIGLIMLSPESFKKKGVVDEILGLKKLVMLFGDAPLFSVERAVVLMSQEEEMEAISSTFFYVAETLELKPCLCYFDPEGDFESKQRVIEHYETLAKIFNYPLKIEEKKVNPIREIGSMDHILQIAPLTKELQDDDMFRIFSMKLSDYLLDSTQHPKLLIPAEA